MPIEKYTPDNSHLPDLKEPPKDQINGKEIFIVLVIYNVCRVAGACL